MKKKKNIFKDVEKSLKQAIIINEQIAKGLRLPNGKCIACESKNDTELWCYYGCPHCVCEDLQCT